MAEEKLNKEQIRFCEGVLSGLEHADAYLNAYVTAKNRIKYDSARVAASRLLSDVNVKQYMAERKQALTKVMQVDAIITKEKILQRMNEVYESAMKGDEVIGFNRGYAVPSGIFNPDRSAAVRATDLQAKVLGVYDDKSNVTINIQNNLNVLEKFMESVEPD